MNTKATGTPAAIEASRKLNDALTRRIAPPPPGLYLGIGPEYYQWDALSGTDGIEVLHNDTPAMLQWLRKHPKKPSKGMIEGTILHCAIVEPDRFEREYRGATARLKGEEKLLKITGQMAIPMELYDRARWCRDAVLAHPECGAYLELATAREASLSWCLEIDGYTVPCKGRPDLLIEPAEIMVDLKTVANGDVSDEALWRTSRKLGYIRKAAFYRIGARVLELPYRQVVMLAVSQKPPFFPRMFHFSAKDLARAADECRRAASLYGRCVSTGEWPGHTGIAEIGGGR